MFLCLKIALVALLSGIAVEGYGLRYSHRRRGSQGREHFQLESLGRNGHRRDYGSHGKHGHFHFYEHPYYRRTTVREELRSRWSYSEESSESDSRYSSEIDEFDSHENSDLYMPKRHPCWLWRCPTQGTNHEHHTSWTREPSSRKTELELPSTTTTKRWNSHPMLESSVNEQSSSEPVTTPVSIPDITMPPKTEFIMSRVAPFEGVADLLTTAIPETSETTMSSPETTTVSQAVLDCMESCISTPEFNPVCGTNDETYDNIGKLFCAKNCGIDVELRRMSRCWPLLPFADDYDDDDENINSTDGNGDRRGNIGDEGSSNDYGDESENSGKRLLPSSDDDSPPPDFEQSPPHGNLPSNPLRNDLSSSPDDESSPSLHGEPLNSISSDPSSSPFDDFSPSPRVKSLLSDVEISPPLDGNGNVVITTDSSNVVSSFTTSRAPRFRRTTHLSDLQNCMKLCPVTTAYYPICGTDLVTYINIDRIECAKGCGLEVQILCEQPCHLCNVGRPTLASSTKISLITTSSATTSRTPTTPVTVQAATIRRNIGNGTPTTLIEQCVKSCPVTPEYNPVCGTNNVNYMNPVHLLCVQMCGDDVKIARFGPCPSESRIETPTATTEGDKEEVTLSPEVIECTKRCVLTSEYNPVCGTNEETYTNPGKLECAKFCGIDVQLSYRGFCNGFFFSEFTSANPRGERGIEGQATASSESTSLPLRTSKLTSVETIPPTTATQSTKSTTPWLLPLAYSPPPSSTFANTPSTTASTPITTTIESLNSTSFTLAPDVLISIFGNATLKTITDRTTKKDEVKIDRRFGHDDGNGANQKGNLDPHRIVFPE